MTDRPDAPDESEPIPEETLGRPVADVRGVDESGRAEFVETYGHVRTYFKSRPERYRGLQRRLKQARVRATYDEYLATSARLAAITSLVGGLVGTAIAAALVLTGMPFQVIDPRLAVAGGGGYPRVRSRTPNARGGLRPAGHRVGGCRGRGVDRPQLLRAARRGRPPTQH